MKQINKSYLYAGLSVLLWSSVATSFKLALNELDFIQLIYFASISSTILFFVIILIQGKAGLICKQTSKQWFYSGLSGLFNPVLYYLILFKAYSLLPAQLAQPLNMVWPIVLTLLSIPMLGHKIGNWSLIGLFVSFTGVVIISSQGSLTGFRETNLLGVALAVGSSLFWSFYWILNTRDNREGIIKLFLNFLIGVLILSPVIYFFSDFNIQVGKGFYAAIYVGIFETGITYIFWMKAMKLSTNSARIGNMVFLTPFLSLLFIRFILNETLYFTTFTGLALIVAGILSQQLEKKSNPVQ